MAFHRAAVVLFVLKLLSSLSEGKETEVSCDFNETCVLPCSFQRGQNILIHWYKKQRDVPVHSYYHDRDQLLRQNQTFKDRTSLFVDEISRGNASLLLREVKLQDEGTYKCYTSTTDGEGKDSYINLRVHAQTIRSDPASTPPPTSDNKTMWIIVGSIAAAAVVLAAVAVVKKWPNNCNDAPNPSVSGSNTQPHAPEVIPLNKLSQGNQQPSKHLSQGNTDDVTDTNIQLLPEEQTAEET